MTETPFSCRFSTHDRIPEDIVSNPSINEAVTRRLPSNYNFEVHKTIWRIREVGAKRIALQFPEGLLMCACALSDILGRFCSVSVLILGDVTYGACCVDDFTARRLGVDMVVHYGHSCLIPVFSCHVNILYVFVEMRMDVEHLVETLRSNFDSSDTLGLVSTIQFVPSLRRAKRQLDALRHFDSPIVIPVTRPLSRGEILGCTSSSHLSDRITHLVYVGDGRFHIESPMMHNPDLGSNFYEYNPYTKVLTHETFSQSKMISLRQNAITSARQSNVVGIILSTLGRQTNLDLFNSLVTLLESKGVEVIRILLSEIYPAKLELLEHRIGAWIQLACPRLSIDWGNSFTKPLLNAYEAVLAWGGDVEDDRSILRVEDGEEGDMENVAYPMSNYADEGDKRYCNVYSRIRPEE